MAGPVGDIFGGNTNPFYNYQGANPVVVNDPMFGPITQDNIDHPYTQPGTTSALVEPTNPWWLGTNPNTGQNPNDYYGSPTAGQPYTPAPPVAVKVTNPNTVDSGTARNLLRQFGLDDLGAMVDGWIAGGLTWPQIEARLYDRGTAEGQVVDTIYPELRLLQEAKQPPRSIAEIQTARLQAHQIISQEGFTDVLPDPNQVARDYLVGGKSLVELQKRLQDIGDWAQYVATTNPTARANLDALQAYYGVQPTRQDLVNFTMTGDEPALHRRLQAAQIGGTATSTGYGPLDKATAEGLAAQGVTADQAQQGFSSLVPLQPEVFGTLTGQQGDQISQADQLGATFGGNANAAERIRRKQRQNVGSFDGGGGFASNREGFSVGTAR